MNIRSKELVYQTDFLQKIDLNSIIVNGNDVFRVQFSTWPYLSFYQVNLTDGQFQIKVLNHYPFKYFLSNA